MVDDRDEERELTTADIAPVKKLSFPERHEFLRNFLQQRDITVSQFGKLAGLSEPLLVRFERADRDLPTDAWIRIFAATTNLLNEDNARQREEITKSQPTGDILGDALSGRDTPLMWSTGRIAAETRLVENAKTADVISKHIDDLLEELSVEILKPGRATDLFEAWKTLLKENGELKSKIAELEQELRALKAKEQSND